jgi:DNA polymerase I-like protein with 3'-5' exonuclease and polymerase domains
MLGIEDITKRSSDVGWLSSIATTKDAEPTSVGGDDRQMRIIHTAETTPDDLQNQQERDWVYNGLDCCVTAEVFAAIHPQLDNTTAKTYSFSRDLQGPVLEMRLRGVLVDAHRKTEVINAYYEDIDRLETQLDEIVLDGVGMHSFNWRSNADLQNLFYNHLQIPPIMAKGRPTVNRMALEKLDVYLVAKPIVQHLMAMRDIFAKIKMLRTGVDPDGRFRTSYNIAGTSTGRFSSSYSEFGSGGNLQNVEESLRSVFIADPGMKFAKFDAKSGESYLVGAIQWNLFNDGRYLDAVESGDVHTAVARICWPKLPWTGDLRRDKDLAEQPYYRHYSYRFMCKKLGHGSNYGGKPATLAGQSRLPEPVVRSFQPNYFRAFPSIIRWHGWVDTQLRTVGNLTSLSGRRRWFFGRRNDPATWREAVAYDPQGSLADIVNGAMLRIWREQRVTLMMQDHDALTFMYPEDREAESIAFIQSLLTEDVPLAGGRTMTIPYDCKTGWNKGNYCCGDKSKNGCGGCHGNANLDGLKDWKGEDRRTRTPVVSLLDRIIR